MAQQWGWTGGRRHIKSKGRRLPCVTRELWDDVAAPAWINKTWKPREGSRKRERQSQVQLWHREERVGCGGKGGEKESLKAFAYQKIFKFPGTLQLQWALGLDALPVWVSVFLLCEMWLILHRAAHEFQKIGNLFLTVSCYVAGFQYTVARKVTSKSHETLSQGPKHAYSFGWQLQMCSGYTQVT